VQLESRNQLKRLIIPIFLEIILLVVGSFISKEYRVYCDMLFYLAIGVYFLALGSINMSTLFQHWKRGKAFWLPVLLTILGFASAFAFTTILSALFPHIDTGMDALRVTNLPSLIAFALTTIFLPPIAEEAFYRKGIINFSGRTALIFSTTAGILLFAAEHSLKPFGILTAAIWAIPLSIAYIKTKNVYISMTAHFLCNFVANGVGVISMTIALLKI
jgi:membrane protease YdiL (CAAX protease family)